jgi:hypothetical protein
LAVARAGVAGAWRSCTGSPAGGAGVGSLAWTGNGSWVRHAELQLLDRVVNRVPHRLPSLWTAASFIRPGSASPQRPEIHLAARLGGLGE